MKSVAVRLIAVSVCLMGGSIGTAHAFAMGSAKQAGPICSAMPLGVAQAYNGFFLGDVQGSGSDTGGKLAVAGNAFFSNYSIGTSVASGTPQNVLIVGGTLQFNRGSINGNVVYGQNGAMTSTSLGGATANEGRPIDFTAAAASLGRLTASLARLPRIGSTRGTYGNVFLTGTNRMRNVFHVSTARLNDGHHLVVSVPKGSTAVIILQGKTAMLQDVGEAMHGLNGTHILLVLPSATSLAVRRVGLKMSVLAPHAAIAFNDGAIAGTVVGASLSGTGHLEPSAFSGCLPIDS